MDKCAMFMQFTSVATKAGNNTLYYGHNIYSVHNQFFFLSFSSSFPPLRIWIQFFFFYLHRKQLSNKEMVNWICDHFNKIVYFFFHPSFFLLLSEHDAAYQSHSYATILRISGYVRAGSIVFIMQSYKHFTTRSFIKHLLSLFRAGRS